MTHSSVPKPIENLERFLREVNIHPQPVDKLTRSGCDLRVMYVQFLEPYVRPGEDAALAKRDQRAQMARKKIRQGKLLRKHLVEVGQEYLDYTMAEPPFPLTPTQHQLHAVLANEATAVEHQLVRLRKFASTPDRLGRGSRFEYLVMLEAYVEMRTSGEVRLTPGDTGLLVNAAERAGWRQESNIEALRKGLERFKERNPVIMQNIHETVAAIIAANHQSH